MLAAMQKIQRYLKYVVYPACIIMFAGAFVCARNAALPAMYMHMHMYLICDLVCTDALLYNVKTEIHSCGHNDDENFYDCDPKWTDEKTCDEYYILGGVHGGSQKEGAERYNEGTASVEPMLVCVTRASVWAALNAGWVNAQFALTFFIFIGPWLLPKTEQAKEVEAKKSKVGVEDEEGAAAGENSTGA